MLAQGPGGFNMDPQQMAEGMTNHMAQEYKLSDDQKKQVLVINQEFIKKMGEQMANGPQGDREEMMKTMRAAREEYNGKLQKIMTEEQYKKYQEDEKNRRRGPGGPQGGPR